MNAPFRASLPLLDNDVMKTFVAIADTGNFSTAAEVVLRTPSAVSMQIKKLEDQLGATLFLRDARSVNLTPQGELLLTYARRLIALSNEAVSRFVMPELSGVVRLAHRMISQSVCFPAFSRILQPSFRASWSMSPSIPASA